MEKSGETTDMKGKGKRKVEEVMCNQGESSSSSSEMEKRKRATGSELNHGRYRDHRQVEVAADLPSFLSYYHGGIYERSPQTMSTLMHMERRRQNRGITPGSIRTIHDNTSRGYGWLLPGWLAEERIMDHGRVYRVSYLSLSLYTLI